MTTYSRLLLLIAAIGIIGCTDVVSAGSFALGGTPPPPEEEQIICEQGFIPLPECDTLIEKLCDNECIPEGDTCQTEKSCNQLINQFCFGACIPEELECKETCIQKQE